MLKSGASRPGLRVLFGQGPKHMRGVVVRWPIIFVLKVAKIQKAKPTKLKMEANDRAFPMPNTAGCSMACCSGLFTVHLSIMFTHDGLPADFTSGWS